MRLLNITTTFLFLLFCYSISYSQIWEKTSDPPAGVSSFSIKTTFENNSVVPFSFTTDGEGLFKSTDGGINWENIGLVGEVLTDMVFIGFDEGNYILSASNGIHKSTDFGETWTHHTIGIEGLFITAIEKDRFLGNEIVIGTATNGAFRSLDNGETWEQFGTGLENETVKQIFHFETQNFDYVWTATTQDGGFWKYDRSTNMWVQRNAGNEILSDDSALAGDSQGQLFLASSNEILTTYSSNIQWEVEVKHKVVNGFAVTPYDQIFASSFGFGIRTREPGATDWVDFSEGLPSDDGFIDVSNIVLDIDGFLWAAITPLNPAITGGIFKTINPVTDVEDISSEIPDRFNLEQNYPNPFNPGTSIQFSLPQTSYVTLEVFNTLGERVGVLASEELTAGTYNYSWDAAGLTSGIYFYKLQAGNFIETKKMVLLR